MADPLEDHADEALEFFTEIVEAAEVFGIDQPPHPPGWGPDGKTDG